jgi:hypothetical protein
VLIKRSLCAAKLAFPGIWSSKPTNQPTNQPASQDTHVVAQSINSVAFVAHNSSLPSQTQSRHINANKLKVTISQKVRITKIGICHESKKIFKVKVMLTTGEM